MKIGLIVLAFLLFFSTPSWSIEVTLNSEVLRQGDVLLITVPGKKNPLANPPSPSFSKGEMGGLSNEDIQGSFMDKKLIFFKAESGDYIALAGIDMKMAPGEYPLILVCEGKKIFERNVKILPASFGTQRLSLPKKMVDLSPEMLKRVKAEQTRLAQLWPVFNEKIWKGKFIMPIKGRIKSSFGLRRIINRQERNPHSGIDIEATDGDPVYAPNSGRVALIDNQYLGGKTLVLDHGYGIYSTFLHLSEIRVSEGDSVHKGDIIGLAGETGRATGPHLHWGVRLQGERINPVSLINLGLD